MPIKHAFTSAKDDGGDDELVRPSDWNADHEVTWTSWSPVIKAGSTTLTFPDMIARYAKLGNAVLWFIRTGGCTSGGTGDIQISGMPSDLIEAFNANHGVIGSGIYQDEGSEWLHVDVYLSDSGATAWYLKKYNDYQNLNKTVGTSPADSFSLQGFVALA